MKRSLILLCLFGMTASVLAQSRPQLGRLFSSPQQRAELDAQRSGPAPASTAPVVAAPPAPAPPPPPMELNGMVARSSGRSTVWLNQNEQQEPYNQLAPGAGTLTLRLSNGQVVLLKPGQRYDPLSGQVVEAPGGQP